MYSGRRTTGERVFNVFNYIVLITISLICVMPFVMLFSKSISEEAYVLSGQVLFLPRGFQLNAYKLLMTSGDFKIAFINSVFITVAGTVIQVFFTGCVGYAVAKQDLPGRRAINFLYIFTMMFGGGMIPTYLVIRETNLINNLFVLVIPGLVAAFNLILVRNYFEGLPPSLGESARIDGAGNLTVLFRIMFPISKPVLATIAIFTAVGIWNSYMGPLLYLPRRQVMVLPVYLQNIIAAAQSKSMDNPEGFSQIASETFRAAAIFISALPILMVYPFLQKYFVQGITLGAVKQ